MGARTLFRWILPAVAGLLAASPSMAQTVKTIVNNGPTTDLYDIVVLGDGYRASEQALFDRDVDSLVAFFRDDPDKFPYGAYFHLYNVHSVFRASNESGADKPPQNVFVDTAYDATYWFGNIERCLYIGDTALAARDAALAPDTDGRVIVLVNDPKYGGCGGTYSVSYNGTLGLDVQAHEWGHSFGNLADEYADLSGTFPGPEPSSPNCTKDPTGATKWQPWLGFPGQYSTVGAYLGACRYPLGIYRPESDCEMRALKPSLLHGLQGADHQAVPPGDRRPREPAAAISHHRTKARQGLVLLPEPHPDQTEPRGVARRRGPVRSRRRDLRLGGGKRRDGPALRDGPPATRAPRCGTTPRTSSRTRTPGT